MGIKKDIGQAFKERLSEFNDSPNNAVWEQIELELKKDKEKDKPIVIWLRYGTIMLALFLLLFLNRDYISGFENNSEINNKTIEKNEQNSNFSSTLNTNQSNVSNSNQASEEIILSNYKDSTHSASTTQSKLNKTQNNKPAKTINPHFKQNQNYTTINSSNNKKSEFFSNHKNEVYNFNTNDSIKIQKDKTLASSLKDSTNAKKELVKNHKKENTDKTTNKDSITDEPKESKWSIYPNVSIVYYDAFKQSFQDQTQLSYGIYFNYLPSNKISLRLGINKLSLQQTFTENNTLTKQAVEYLEIPFEVKYSFTQNNISPYFIGGASYLAISDAELSITENNITSSTSNKNDFSNLTISINAGLGVQTKLHKNFYFNAEGLFKYHLKPYSESVDFYPYTISILGGIEYKF
ncbi:porin family protein [Gaetbulibacter sp. NE]|uniref:porin family protein n=1 Tax=Gaetbulibacter sp. NE TaxID=2982307 RepID=UPI0021D2C2F6|nr:porin family protein [Gaetbulibacter sp. NE]